MNAKWIFKEKAGGIFKGRLVAKGLRQVHGIDYDETFSPVAMLKSIRILLAISAYMDYEIWKMDVKTAFLNGNLLEDVYMKQLEVVREGLDTQTPVEDTQEMDSNSQEVVIQEPITQVPRRSGRIRQELQRYGFIVTDEQDIMIIDHDEPASYQEAMKSPNSDK